MSQETAFKENANEVSLQNVYYFRPIPAGEQFVKGYLPPLSNDKTLTENDRLLVQKANAAYVTFMDTCIDKLKNALPKHEQLPVMKRHRNRIAKLTL